MKKPQPTQTESPFLAHEMFFSLTDLKGIIEAGNEIFVRVSGYSKEFLIGKPHNVIRHPDMPRAVFRLLWSTIQAGKPIAAYVKNIDATGRYYWVLACVFPVDGRYLSLRIKPSSTTLGVVSELYSKVSSFEKTHSIEESLDLISEQLASKGFPSYEEFQTHAINQELAPFRNGSVNFRKIYQFRDEHKVPALFHKILESCTSANTPYQELFAWFDTFRSQQREFQANADFVLDVCKDLRLYVYNMMIHAEHAGSEGDTLATVASGLSSFSQDISASIDSFAHSMKDMQRNLLNADFLIQATYMQFKMIESFLLAHDGDKEETPDQAELTRNLLLLTQLAQKYSAVVFEAVEAVRVESSRLKSVVDRLQSVVIGLKIVQLSGRIEASKIARAHAAAFEKQFASLSEVFEGVRHSITNVYNVVSSFANISVAACDRVQQVRSVVQKMHVE